MFVAPGKPNRKTCLFLMPVAMIFKTCHREANKTAGQKEFAGGQKKPGIQWANLCMVIILICFPR